jgi:hypothetical protein
MRNLIFLALAFFLVIGVNGQSREALEGTHNLQERFEIMKEKAESYTDYKVIKNDVLNGVWKISMDSLAKARADLKTANATIANLNSQIQGASDKVKQAESTMAESEYERTHLSVFGIPMGKGIFVTTALIVVAALIIALLTVLGTFNVLRRSNREKELTIHGIMSEFDAFRKKALEKEVKISRELQSERNKLSAIGKN